MIRPLSNTQLAARALQHATVSDRPPGDTELAERVKALETDNLRLRQDVSRYRTALDESEVRVGKLDKQCRELTVVRSPRKDQEEKIAELTKEIEQCKNALVTSEDLAATQTLQLAEAKLQHQSSVEKITALEKQLAQLDTEKASLAKQVFTLSEKAEAPARTPTIVKIVDITDKRAEDGAVMATVKLDDADASVYLVASLDMARKLLRKIKEAD